MVMISLVLNLGVRGSEMADSGWHVATPSTSPEGNRHTDPTIRIAINRMLEETHVPLLPEKAAGARPSAVGQVTPIGSELSIDGWRPARVEGLGFGVQGSELALPRPESRTPHPSPEPGTLNPEPIPPQSPPAVSDERGTKNLGPLLRAVGRPEFTAADPDEVSTSSAPTTEPGQAPAAADANEPRVPGPTFNATDDGQPAPAHKPQTANDERRAVDVESDRVEITDEPAGSGFGVQGSEQASPKPEPPTLKPDPLPPLSRNMQYLRNKVRRVLKGYYNKPLNSRDHDPWEMMHGMLAYGIHSRTSQGGPRGELITSVGWLCYNRPCKRLTLLQVTPQGELRAKYGVGLQGHMGQFLAMLAQCKVSPEYPIRVGKHEFTIDDLIVAEKTTCYQKEELTFKLIALMHYLESDAQWVNDQGQSWDIAKLIREELAQPIRGAACGGTHRLAGLSLAARTRVARGEPLDGEFARAAEYVEKCHNYAFKLQNRDGSLSTEWFRGRGDDPDLDRRIKTTGHILEWLIYSVSDEELQNSRTVRAVSYLANLLYSNFDHEWEIGPRSHALHALALYDERVFALYDGQEEVAGDPASRPTTSRARSRARQR
jgi:hypothetical protein